MAANTRPGPNTFATPLVGTSPIQVIPANGSRLGLFVYNPGTVATLAICGDDVVNPTVNGAGTLTLLPGAGMQLDGWTRALVAIASTGASNPITVMEFS